MKGIDEQVGDYLLQAVKVAPDTGKVLLVFHDTGDAFPHELVVEEPLNPFDHIGQKDRLHGVIAHVRKGGKPPQRRIHPLHGVQHGVEPLFFLVAQFSVQLQELDLTVDGRKRLLDLVNDAAGHLISSNERARFSNSSPLSIFTAWL